MTPAEIQTTVENIVSDLSAVSAVAAGVDPALVPLIAIGRSVASQLPGLAAAVTSWIQGNPPTDAEKADLLQKLSVLDNPNLP